jgi:hypothetical protein
MIELYAVFIAAQYKEYGSNVVGVSGIVNGFTEQRGDDAIIFQ